MAFGIWVLDFHPGPVLHNGLNRKACIMVQLSRPLLGVVLTGQLVLSTGATAVDPENPGSDLKPCPVSHFLAPGLNTSCIQLTAAVSMLCPGSLRPSMRGLGYSLPVHQPQVHQYLIGLHC